VGYFIFLAGYLNAAGSLPPQSPFAKSASKPAFELAMRIHT